MRNNFEHYEETGKRLSKCDHYSEIRRRHRKLLFQKSNTEVIFNAKTDMRVNTFNKILDNLIQEYINEVENMFGFLTNLSTFTDEKIRKKAAFLQSTYQGDIEKEFPEECIQFMHI